jgi:nucleoside-diphosphate-sugar epimerase
MMKIAIVGATGPTGIHLVTELRKSVATVRVIARSTDKLARLFPEAAVEKLSADILDADATLHAVDGCDIVYDCIGLPGDQMHLHPLTARNIAGALRRTKTRCVQVSSYWAYYPQVRVEMNENHPRSGGPPWVRYRREAEDVLYEAGAAILHLPDFYGPHVHVSTLQNGLNEAASGRRRATAEATSFQLAALHNQVVRGHRTITATNGDTAGMAAKYFCHPEGSTTECEVAGSDSMPWIFYKTSYTRAFLGGPPTGGRNILVAYGTCAKF